MRNRIPYKKLIPIALFLLLPLAARAETMTLGTAGKVHIFQPPKPPQKVAILISGKQGFAGEASTLAPQLVDDDTMVIGVDYLEYRKVAGDEKFDCPCGDLAHAAEFVEKQKKIGHYIPPVLIGLHEGSVPVYAAITEAPNTFAGAITVDFQQQAPGIQKMCRGDGMRFRRGPGDVDTFLPDPDSRTPWVLFGSNAEDVKYFLEKTPGARLDTAKTELAAKMRAQIDDWSSHATLKASIDLPFVELPSKTDRDPLVMIVTGDGGWSSLDRDLGEYLSAQGYAVVGFDLLRYLWTNPTPDQGTRDLDRAIHFYCEQWKKPRALLIGYSMGADVLPYMVPKLPAQTASMLAGVVLIGPSNNSEFSLDITDAKQEDLTTGPPLLPMVKAIHAPVLCIGGSVEKESLCRHVARNEKGMEHIRVELLESGHMFHDNYEEITNLIYKNLNVLNQAQK